MTSSLPPLVQAFSGAIGSASSNALVYPFALATTRLQLDSPQKAKKVGGLSGAYRILHKIVRKHGLSSLYTGLATDTGATLLSNFFYFYFYAFLRYLSTRRRLSLNPNPKAASAPHKPGLGEEILLGFVAGVMSRAISTPLNIVTTRLQQEHEEDENEDKEGFMGVVNKIYGEHGLQGFWRGFKTAFLLCMNPALTLAFFQVFRRILARASTGKEPNPRQAFLMGAISNSIASVIMYPLMLAKTRQYASSSPGSSLAGALRNAYLGSEPSGLPAPAPGAKSQPSVAGLYQGLETQLVKGFLSQGVTFLVKGRIEELIVWVYTRRTR
uniref:Mitochondrial carrier n=1 Tax=Mycena chlorophos TaxID=658473 RepID=A0ABQ0LK35_MYCCL|nr:predicted protein [Mycena chlorophos]